ncbi:response regulator transcription factor [Cohnella sp. JJ-181]|uniref:response regulator transcription factor n=1 Tax=Cohnella rhizoplanae TaxID=2974897 RepID=UPI0022FFB441|nr:response regulator transcription factor [Cohnella sp. JJ-181]CAI6078545.1 DNA-binding transcriptional activator DevR/DosR [Cohnella sp. JJ-181]
MKPIRLLLVEDDPDWVKSMSVYLNREEDLLVAGTAGTSEEALKLAASIEFDVALLDVHLSKAGRDGIYIALALTALRPVRIVMLTSDASERTMTDAFTAGALHYLDKSRFRELPQVIRSAYHHPEPMEALLKELKRLKREEQLMPLTAAEREVFEMLEAGYTHPQIERKLFKAESTLKNQVNRILKKLGVRSGREAVDKVRKNGLDNERD